jgi:hypothetical protein
MKSIFIHRILSLVFLVMLSIGFGHIALADLNDGLVAFYPFNGNANDESGNGYDGIIHGDTSLSEDRFGNFNRAYYFDGYGDYIEIGQQPNFPFWDTYAVSVWFLNDGEGDTSVSYGQKIIDKTVFWHDFYLSVHSFSNGQLVYITYEGSGGGIVDSSYDYRDSEWHHAIINKSGSYGELWVDGNLIGTSNIIKTVNSWGKLLIGYSTSSDGFQRKYWSGKIDDIRIYNRSLSGEEIQILYTETPTSQALIEALIQQVIALNLKKGISNSLDAKLENAIKALDDTNANNDSSAINKLNAFINEVNAQRNVHISATDADELIADVNEIITQLETDQ